MVCRTLFIFQKNIVSFLFCFICFQNSLWATDRTNTVECSNSFAVSSPHHPEYRKLLSEFDTRRERRGDFKFVKSEERPRIYIPENPAGIAVLVHGMGGSPKSVGPLREDLVKRGQIVLEVLLSGHGQENYDSVGNFRLEHWIADLDEAVAVARLTKLKITLTGYSFGGSLVIHHMLAHKKTIYDRAILVAPAFGVAAHIVKEANTGLPTDRVFGGLPKSSILSILELIERNELNYPVDLQLNSREIMIIYSTKDNFLDNRHPLDFRTSDGNLAEMHSLDTDGYGPHGTHHVRIIIRKPNGVCPACDAVEKIWPLVRNDKNDCVDFEKPSSPCE